jgi:GNAT superfamily N-acetyltransferase
MSGSQRMPCPSSTQPAGLIDKSDNENGVWHFFRSNMNMAIMIEYNKGSLTFDEFHPIDAECFPDEPLDAATFEALAAHDLWAVRDSGCLVGYCCTEKKADLTWLRRIGVVPGYRRQGIGRRMMDVMVDHSVKAGLPRMMLFVRADNAGALRLYDAYGFYKAEATWQYIITAAKLRDLTARPPGASIRAITIDKVAEGGMPPLPPEWMDIRTLHNPPQQYVFVFCDSCGDDLGYCRLTPGFPGCFPFVLAEPAANFIDALRELESYLLPEKDFLKLTVSDETLAATCDSLGLRLNYQLSKMIRQNGA